RIFTRHQLKNGKKNEFFNGHIHSGMLPTRLQLLILLSFAAKYFEAHPDFSIDYANRTFLFDDQPYRYISGEVHYFRIRPEQWKDRLSKIRAAGLNAIQTYIPWNFHENFEREYNFVGDRDIIHFLDLAAAQNLSVLLRIGPYICAEWENGGLPWWLLKYPNITMRSSDPNFVKEVQRWWNILLPKFVPYLRRNGGPIIMIQLENEYGSYRCDRSYLQQLRDLSRSLLGNDTIFFTTDASTLLSCGHIDGTFATVDFGSLKSITMAESVFRQQNLYNNNGGPNVNSEYYPGWFSTWGGPEPKHSNTEEIARMFHMMLSMNASFNYYMFHGGTNFGFWNGAEIYAAVTTSYDYFAPLTESGDITDVYTTIHDLIANITDWSNRPAEQLPPPSRYICAACRVLSIRRLG
uniref:Glycoside hydrolase 35 catalytic domain-containing protein n=3 Tax=Parascaris univalens TaxID=6257 RepID=A0A915B8Z8_PARUN